MELDLSLDSREQVYAGFLYGAIGDKKMTGVQQLIWNNIPYIASDISLHLDKEEKIILMQLHKKYFGHFQYFYNLLPSFYRINILLLFMLSCIFFLKIALTLDEYVWKAILLSLLDEKTKKIIGKKGFIDLDQETYKIIYRDDSNINNNNNNNIEEQVEKELNKSFFYCMMIIRRWMIHPLLILVLAYILIEWEKKIEKMR